MRQPLHRRHARVLFRTAQAAILGLVCALVAANPAHATTRVWENTGTTFSTNGNWVGNNAPANNLTSDIASFQAATPSFQPNFTANRSVNGIEFTNGTGAWIFTGSGAVRTLTLGGSGIVSNDDSTQTFNNANLAIALGANAAFTSNSTGALSFGSSLSSFSLGSFTLTLGGTSTNAGNQIAEPISGTGSIIKSDTGTWALTGTSSYTGTTTINGGVLSVSVMANGSSNSSIGASSNGAGNLVINGGTLQYTGTGHSSNRQFTLGTSGGTLDASGTGALNLTSTGGVTLSGTNTARTLTLTGSSTAANTLAATIGNNGTGATSITKTGAGTWVLSGNNSYTGKTVINEGILSISSEGNLGGNPGSSVSDQLTLNGGTLQTTASLTINDANREIFIGANGGTFDVRDSGETTTISSSNVISGSGTLTKIGDGILRLQAANTHTGNIVINAGTLRTSNTSSIGNSATVTINGGSSIWQIDSSETIGNLMGDGQIVFSANRTLTLGTASDSVFSGTISDGTSNGNLVKTGTGTLTLSGTSSYSGSTTISQGTIQLNTSAPSGSNGALGNATSTVTINNGSTGANNTGLVIGASGVSVNRNLNVTNNGSGTVTLGGNIASGTGTFAGNITLNRSVNLNADGTSVITFGNGATSGGVISGAGGITKTGTGTVVMDDTHTYTGITTISQGTIQLNNNAPSGASGSLGNASSTVTINNGSTGANNTGLVIGASGVSVNRNLNVTNNGSGTVTLGGNIASGTGTFAGNITLNRSVNLNADGTSVITFGNGATSGGVISGTGGITKTGTGTVVMDDTHTYTGTTTVSQGTLQAATNSSLGSSSANVTVNSDATLALAGGVNITRSGTLTLNGDGTSSDTGALHAAGASGTTSQWTGSITVNTASTITAADNLLIIGNGATGMFNTTTLTLNDDITFHTPDVATVVPTYLPSPSYVLDPANIVVNSRIVGTGDLIKTGDGTLSIIRGTSIPNTFSGDTHVLGGKLIVEGPSNQAHLSSPNIFVGNSGSSNNDTVVLQAGQATGAAPGNNMIGVYDAGTNASTSNLTIYEDGLFNMNRSSNGFVNLTLHGGHVDGVGLNPLLTISGDLLSKASAQTGLIENLNLGIGSNNLTLDVESGTTSSGVDLLISAKIQQGVGFTALASGTSLEKTGEGKVVFSGANTYGGITQVSNGVLNIQNATALGQNSGSLGSTNHGTVVTGDGQLQLEGGLTIANETLTLSGTGHGGSGALRSVSGDNTLNGFVYLNADSRIESDTGSLLTIANPNGVNSSILDGNAANTALTVGGGGDTTINGAIGSNIGSITKQGDGTLTLAGNNSYTGATTVSDGALKITHSNGLSGSGVSVADGAALQFAQNASDQNITAVGIAATIQGTGIGDGGAIQNLDGDNTYLGNVTLADNARIAADNGSSLTLSGSVSGAGFTLNTGGAGNTTYNGVIGGSGTALNKTDAGTVTLGGTSDNTYTGATSIADGTLALNKTAGVTAISSTTVTIGDGSGGAGSATLLLSQSNQINDNAALALDGDGLFDMNGKNETVGSIAGDGSIVFGTGQLTIGGNNSNSDFSGTLVGDSTALLTKNGSGTLTIDSNVNASPGDFAGSVTVNAGTLAFEASNAFTGTFNVYAGTTLKLTDIALNITNLNFLGTGSITLDFSGASTLSVTNLSLAAGVTVNVINWTDAVDYFFAQNWIGATQDQTGSAPMNQIVFAGGSPPWTGNNTIWQSYDDQITPVPEPSTYGAMLIGAIGAFLGYRRWRRQNTKPKA